MKKMNDGLKLAGFVALAACALMVGLALTARVDAAHFPPQQAHDTLSFTLLSATTNQTGSAQAVDGVLYHTVQIVNTTIRTNTVYLDRSLDGTYWTPFYTNTMTNSGVVLEVQCLGKWAFMRGRLDSLEGTNCAVTFTYLGGR